MSKIYEKKSWRLPFFQDPPPSKTYSFTLALFLQQIIRTIRVSLNSYSILPFSVVISSYFSEIQTLSAYSDHFQTFFLQQSDFFRLSLSWLTLKSVCGRNLTACIYLPCSFKRAALIIGFQMLLFC